MKEVLFVAYSTEKHLYGGSEADSLNTKVLELQRQVT